MSLQCSLSAIDPLVQWMALRRDLHVGAALKKRLKFAVPIGVFITLTSLPILGMNVDPLNAAFGISLLLLAVVIRFSAHPALFLGLALNWILLAASNIRSIVNGSRWIIPLTIFALVFAYGALKTFAFYRRVAARA